MKKCIVLFFLISILTYAKDSNKIWNENPKFKGISQDGIVRFNDFSKLAKILSPTVANLQVDIEVKEKSMMNDFYRNDPMYRFFDHFFEDVPHRKFRNRGIGSGILISQDGYILTNNHVIQNARAIKVTLLDDETVYDAKVIGSDAKTDVALIKITSNKKFPFAYLGNSDKLEIGEWVMAIGNPFGLQHTVTSGIVSAKGRKDINLRGGGYHNFIQTDASINPGNSGGPLFNLQGEVIGINTAINASGQGIGFAIPINMAKKVIGHILKYGEVKRAWLGVTIQEISKELAESFNMKQLSGALITSIIKSSPADLAGLEVGDVILKFDNKKIKKSQDLSWLASMSEIGKKKKLEILRNGKIIYLDVMMEAMPNKRGYYHYKNNVINKGNPLNIEVKDIPKSYKIDGVIVTNMMRNSIAMRAGLMLNDVIVSLNNNKIKNVKDFNLVISKLKKGELIRLYIKRGYSNIFIAFRL